MDELAKRPPLHLSISGVLTVSGTNHYQREYPFELPAIADTDIRSEFATSVEAGKATEALDFWCRGEIQRAYVLNHLWRAYVDLRLVPGQIKPTAITVRDVRVTKAVAKVLDFSKHKARAK